MKKIRKSIVVIAVVSILTGIFSMMEIQAAQQFDGIAAVCYVAKGEKITVLNKDYPGKMSIISSGGNKVKISGRKIIVTVKKSGRVIFRAGQMEIPFTIVLGDDSKQRQVKYSDYNIDMTHNGVEYHNFIDFVRDQKKNERGKICLRWNSKKDNKVLRETNKSLCIGEKMPRAIGMYPKWCKDTLWIGDMTFIRNTYYYDKKSDCVFYKSYGGTDDEQGKIKEIEWGCWKNGTREAYVVEKI